MATTTANVEQPDLSVDPLIASQQERLQKKDEARMASQLPKPMGYKLLIALPKPKEKTDGGLYKARETMELEEVSSVVGFVLELGPDAYQGESSPGVPRYPNGPYCKKGDWVIMRGYAGTRIKVYGEEFRLINDDSVEAVVEDPQGIVRA